MLTVGSVVGLAREVLQDTFPESYRWTDVMLFRYAFDARRQLNAVRPATCYNGVDLIRYDYPTVLDGDDAQAQYGGHDLLLDERWRECLSAYVCYRAFILDASDTANLNLASVQHTRFRELAGL